jgi:hypothetical protein
MITEVLIENFKCFERLILPDLGRITLISGQNNTGKTALLESLFLFFDRMSANMIIKQYGWLGVGSVITTPEEMWGPIFSQYDLTKELSISLWVDRKPEKAKYRFNPNFMLESLPPSEMPQDSGGKSVRTDIKPVPSFSLDVEYEDSSGGKMTAHLVVSPRGAPGIKHDYVPTPRKATFIPAKTPIPSRENSDRFSRLTKIGREDEVVEFLKIIEPRLKKLANITEGPEPVIYGDVGLGKMIPIPFMGEGMSHMLNMILAICECENTTILVDEVDNGIHHSVLPKMWEAIGNAAEAHQCQVIATTHSYECIEAAHKGLANRPGDLRYIRLDREGNVTTAKTSNYEMLGSAIAHNMEIR